MIGYLKPYLLKCKLALNFRFIYHFDLFYVVTEVLIFLGYFYSTEDLFQRTFFWYLKQLNHFYQPNFNLSSWLISKPNRKYFNVLVNIIMLISLRGNLSIYLTASIDFVSGLKHQEIACSVQYRYILLAAIHW